MIVLNLRFFKDFNSVFESIVRFRVNTNYDLGRDPSEESYFIYFIIHI